MGDYGHEISKDENDKRLLLIEIHDGRCPVCDVNYLTKIEDELYVHGFDQGRHIFLCDNCGVVARKDVKYIPVKPTVYWYKYGPSIDIKE